MKRFMIFVFVLLFIPAFAFADFLPTKLKLSASPVVQYDFDGTNLSIPVTVTGTNANLTFLVYTKDQAESIGKVRNGNLGWHYVNGVDTCVYYSDQSSLEKGSNTVIWDGNDQDGNIVPAGEYTYYMWAFDHVSSKVRATPEQIMTHRNNLHIMEYDEDGLPLVQPFFHFKSYFERQGYTGQENNWEASIWTIGNDPADEGLIETSSFELPEDVDSRRIVESGLFHPTDFSTYYIIVGNTPEKTLGMRKYTWVPNGPSTHVDGWGDRWSHGAEWKLTEGTHTDGDYIYFNTSNPFIAEPMAYLYIVDFDGSLVEAVSLDGWFNLPDEYFRDDGADFLNVFGAWESEKKGKLFMGGLCMWTMQDPQRYLDTGDLDDLMLWANTNGDYINDKAWEPDSVTPWLCFAGAGPHIESYYADSNLFSSGGQYDMGAVSFALLGPDGTGIGNSFAFAGETAAWKQGPIYVQSGSAYDGMYPDNKSAEEDTGGTWFIAHDSIKGVITSEPVSVADDQPSVFAVEQNSPNPFNPTTTISFTITEASNVTVDVFNVAGQRVGTIAREFMGAGSHSVTWNASAFSAGVYFYTVKSGGFSRTMKMTLLK